MFSTTTRKFVFATIRFPNFSSLEFYWLHQLLFQFPVAFESELPDLILSIIQNFIQSVFRIKLLSINTFLVNIHTSLKWLPIPDLSPIILDHNFSKGRSAVGINILEFFVLTTHFHLLNNLFFYAPTGSTLSTPKLLF